MWGMNRWSRVCEVELCKKALASVINSSVKTLYLIFLDQKLAFNNLLGYFYFQNFVALPGPGYGSARNGD